MTRPIRTLAARLVTRTSGPSAAAKRLIAFGAVAMMLMPSGASAAYQSAFDFGGPTSAALSGLPHLQDDMGLVEATGVVLVAVNISQQQLDDLAAIGRLLEKKDALARELRRRQSRDAGQFGFDVGMGVAKGQTLPGPGKDRVGEALSAAERLGFDVAVKYSLERNNNLKLATVGAAIAKMDREVQAARTADRDVFYWLGFDIATGIYGDPALGALGNTATGPGAFKIRDALSPAAQRGFNDSVTFHLARVY